MTKKCFGCGVNFQTSNASDIGYINPNNYDRGNVCERCFRINNYNEYKTVIKKTSELTSILKSINKSKDLVVLVIDVFNMPKDLEVIKQFLTNDILLVLTKRDLLPKSVNDNKLLNYVDNYDLKFIDKLVVSSNKNYHFDLLYEKIMKYKKSKNVYIVGYTNAGKSTLINKFIYNYSKLNNMITTSMLPNTTINNINVDINEDLTIIDTPGIVNDGSIINYVDFKTLKKLLPKKEVKPITYQIKIGQSFSIDKLLQININKPNDITLYISNQLMINRTYKDEKIEGLKKHILKVPDNSDVVISDLGFVKIKKATTLTLYTLDNVEVFIRKALI